MFGKTLNRPDYRKAEREAAKLLDDFYIAAPPVNPIVMAEQLGIHVKFVTFTGNSSGISGYYDCKDDSIYVNADEYPLRQTFTIAHELGHRVLHKDWAESEAYKVLWRDEGRQGRDFREQEANAFAASLLMPKYLLDKYVDRISPPSLSTLFAVSLPAMKVRLSHLYGI